MKFNFDATGIGSVPFKDPKTACRAIFDNFPNIPFWPQLPKRTFLEHMYVQYSEGIPGIVINDSDRTIHMDSRRAFSEIECFYEKYLAGDLDYFAISKERASGFYEFLDSFRALARNPAFVKGHVTGPVSFALSITDESKQAVIYNKDLFEAITKSVAMKARWQARKLKGLAEGVIIFIDEPYLVSIGSSYVNIDAGLAAAAIEEVALAIRDEGALAGVHCCGNTDWPLLLKRGIDILNFDAYNFSKELLLYTDDIKAFTAGGGTIAWGVVPSSEGIDGEDLSALAGRIDSVFAAMAAKGIAKDSVSSVITPSCGLGTLDENHARKILEMTSNLSRKLTGR